MRGTYLSALAIVGTTFLVGACSSDDDDNAEETGGTGGAVTGGSGGHTGGTGGGVTGGTGGHTGGGTGGVMTGGTGGVMTGGTGGATGGSEGAEAGAAGAGPVGLRMEETILVADQTGVATETDATLLNAWGLAINAEAAGGPRFWVALNHSGVAKVFNSAGLDQGLVVTIPTPTGTGTSAPTGAVFNSSTTDFMGDRFIFVSEDGTVTGWQSGANAALRADLSPDNAIFKGVGIVETASGPVLWTADFHNGMVRVFDATYTAVPMPGAFLDADLPAGYAPFNIFPNGDQVYVSYALQDATAEDDDHGPGRGFVDVFDTEGTLVRRLISDSVLNSPWGMAIAPASFGALAGSLLVGNFGDGAINAFDPETGELLGALDDSTGAPLLIDGLWAIAVGPNTVTEDLSGVLFFTAGPNDEANGRFGMLEVGL